MSWNDNDGYDATREEEFEREAEAAHADQEVASVDPSWERSPEDRDLTQEELLAKQLIAGTAEVREALGSTKPLPTWEEALADAKKILAEIKAGPPPQSGVKFEYASPPARPGSDIAAHEYVKAYFNRCARRGLILKSQPSDEIVYRVEDIVAPYVHLDPFVNIMSVPKRVVEDFTVAFMEAGDRSAPVGRAPLPPVASATTITRPRPRGYRRRPSRRTSRGSPGSLDPGSSEPPLEPALADGCLGVVRRGAS